MSLQIKLNGEVMDTDPDLAVNLELVSPFLAYEDILSHRATIPALPATRHNRKVLGFPDLLQSDAVGMRYNCEEYFNGQLL